MSRHLDVPIRVPLDVAIRVPPLLAPTVVRTVREAPLTLRRLVLVDPSPPLCAAWREVFEDEDAVEVIEGRFEQLDRYDCLVSPANSFGLMDGGVDLAITRFFGFELMDRVQARVVSDWFGEQPVGTSMLVETGHPEHPWLAHTPTMRVPKDIQGTDAVYVAMLAMLREIELFNRTRGAGRIGVVACPGLGTGTGRVSPTSAARQMALAWRSVRAPITAITWEAAANRETSVRACSRP